MGKHHKNISTDNQELCRKLLESPRSLPKNTLSEYGLFEHTLESILARNKARIIRDIRQLIVPSAEILAVRGARHLKILRETTNTTWSTIIPFYGLSPQLSYGLGFEREAFTREQLQKLDPSLEITWRISSDGLHGLLL
ncbi:phosphatidylserine decarboxylase protein [Rutstroemia sp. NJR-2017a BBW]|nr:phosphatidylserine decarboxylase protein [Rutstroemia sp. NJR-2017a BBW]